MEQTKNLILGTYTIWGPPIVLKNNKKIIMLDLPGQKHLPHWKPKKRPSIKESDKAERYRAMAMHQLYKQQQEGSEPITEPISVSMFFYGAWQRKSGNLPDISNLYQMPEDLLQTTGIIADDRQIEDHDGSARICMCDYPCPDRPRYKVGKKKGQMKERCGAVLQCEHQCVRIIIRPAVEREGLIRWEDQGIPIDEGE